MTYEVGEWALNVAVADFNRDGHSDLAVAFKNGGGVSVLLGKDGADSHNSAVLFLGNGDGTFQPPRRFQGGIYNPTQLEVADFNGDGKQDVVIANGSANSLAVLLGDGQGAFRSAVTLATGNWPHSIALGDFNRDGKPDVATANRSTDVGVDSISVLINDTPR